MSWIDLKMIRQKINELNIKLKNNLIKAGVDEVGRGCLAGPVISAAVILNKRINLKLIKDSKKINFQNRLLLSKYIKIILAILLVWPQLRKF